MRPKSEDPRLYKEERTFEQGLNVTIKSAFP